MISILLTSMLFAPIVAPRSDATCYGAPEHVLTDNVPIGNGIRTSVVNIWAFLEPRSTSVAGWIYKNGQGNFYVQFNRRANLNAIVDRTVRDKYLGHSSLSGRYPIVQVNASELLNLENALLASGFIRVGCFKRDYNIPG